jgi:hypothetical protein
VIGASYGLGREQLEAVAEAKAWTNSMAGSVTATGMDPLSAFTLHDGADGSTAGLQTGADAVWEQAQRRRDVEWSAQGQWSGIQPEVFRTGSGAGCGDGEKVHHGGGSGSVGISNIGRSTNEQQTVPEKEKSTADSSADYHHEHASSEEEEVVSPEEEAKAAVAEKRRRRAEELAQKAVARQVAMKKAEEQARKQEEQAQKEEPEAQEHEKEDEENEEEDEEDEEDEDEEDEEKGGAALGRLQPKIESISSIYSSGFRLILSDNRSSVFDDM